jgi:hypothetical protein
MAELKMPHSGHNKHLCYLTNMGFHDRKFKDYVSLVENPKYICRQCGRAAGKAKNLCKPRKIGE